MTTIFIIHGTMGSPNVNWFSWLKLELEKLDHKAYTPKFPTPENQNLDTWLNMFREYEPLLDENSILIGHSLGPSFILNVLERLNHPIKAVFLVAGFTGLLGNKTFDELNISFTDRKFDWNKIKNNCQHFFVYSSDNDPYVPLEEGLKLAKGLGVELKIIPNAAHFNDETGWNKIEFLLEDIKQLL